MISFLHKFNHEANLFNHNLQTYHLLLKNTYVFWHHVLTVPKCMSSEYIFLHFVGQELKFIIFWITVSYMWFLFLKTTLVLNYTVTLNHIFMDHHKVVYYLTIKIKTTIFKCLKFFLHCAIVWFNLYGNPWDKYYFLFYNLVYYGKQMINNLLSNIIGS